jgi:hypothetical protein
MSETRRTPLGDPAKSQVRRAQRGIVAAYIHQLSERHGEPRARSIDAQPSTEAREGG